MDEVSDLALVIIGALVISIALALIFAYPAMLLFGIVHSFLPVIPAFGYLQTFVIMALLRLLFPSGASTISS